MNDEVLKKFNAWRAFQEGTSKAQIAIDNNVSPRTIGRWIEYIDSLGLDDDVNTKFIASYGHDAYTRILVMIEDIESPSFKDEEEQEVEEDLYLDWDTDEEDIDEFYDDLDDEIDWGVDDLEEDEVEYRVLATRKSINISRLVNDYVENTVVIDRGNETFDSVFAIISEGNMSQEALHKAYMMCSPKVMVEKLTQGKLTIDVSKDQITFNAGGDAQPYVVNNLLTRRIISTISEKGVEGAQSLINFMERLMENPSNRSVEELYGFVEHSDIEINADGYLIVWKKVRENYFDIHSNSIDNSPGQEPRVARNMVDENSSNTCSHGLHVCAKSYLDYFGSCSSTDRVVRCLLDPKDVVSIPSDYNNSKLRCSGYKVLDDVTDTWRTM